MLLDDLRAFARDPKGYPDSAAAKLCADAADMIAALRHPASDGRAEAQFLLDRLEELDDADDAEYVREFEGHVRPAMSRLKSTLSQS